MHLCVAGEIEIKWLRYGGVDWSRDEMEKDLLVFQRPRPVRVFSTLTKSPFY